MPSSQQDHDRSIARLLLEPYSTSPADAHVYWKPTSAPTNGVDGDMYFDSATHTIKSHNGTSFANFSSAPRTIKNAVTTLTAADSGALCVWGTAAGYTYTLPVPAAGLSFDFVVAVTITSSAAKVITSAGTEFILGSFLQIPDTAAQAVYWNANGTTIRSWNGNGGSTGGFAGDSFRLTAISTTQWVISNGVGLATGTEATPFATT